MFIIHWTKRNVWRIDAKRFLIVRECIFECCRIWNDVTSRGYQTVCSPLRISNAQTLTAITILSWFSTLERIGERTLNNKSSLHFSRRHKSLFKKLTDTFELKTNTWNWLLFAFATCEIPLQSVTFFEIEKANCFKIAINTIIWIVLS